MTQITKKLIEQHGLSQEEYQKIFKILGREPNINELGIFSVMWSEHCSYKSSRLHLKKFPTTGDVVVQGPGENAGVIDIGDGDCIAFKMESHNHPSFIEPYQGAATGVGGILRDVFTMGARPIANLNSLRFGAVDHEKTPFLVGGVVAGIAGYGNCMGIPTIGGEVYFDDCYNGNILVNAMTVGLVKKDKIFKGFATGVGNPVIYVGSKTGRDGIHGATMASGSFDDESDQKRPTVQVGDPFVEKLLLEACLELMATDAIVGIQDMGAAGLTSSSFEMASRAGTGIEMDLDKIPQRETGMTAYEMLLSESQERMLMVVKQGREKDVETIFHKWDLDASVVGKVTDTKRMVIKHKNEVVVDVPIDPLAHAAPIYDRPQKEPAYLKTVTQEPKIEEPRHCEEAEGRRSNPERTGLPRPSGARNDGGRTYENIILDLLSSPTLASKKWVYRQYDHMVMTGTVIKPGADAGLVRVADTNKAVSVSVGCNSRYVYLNPRVGAQIAVAETGRNVVCTGAKPLAITDCLNFGNPEKPEIMWQFVQACEGISEACRELNTPVVSGNVSLYNETHDESIFPTPTIGMVGLIKDIKHRIGAGFVQESDVIIVLGETFSEIGGSEYMKLVTGKIQGSCPNLDLDVEKNLWETVDVLNRGKFLRSAHDLSEGGLIVSLFESAFFNQMGFKIEIHSDLRADHFLFGESQSRILISVAKDKVRDVLPLLKNSKTPYLFLGDVRKNHATVLFNGKTLVDQPLKAFHEAYAMGFEKGIFHA